MHSEIITLHSASYVHAFWLKCLYLYKHIVYSVNVTVLHALEWPTLEQRRVMCHAIMHDV